MLFIEIILFILTGALAGVSAGLLGLGGGVVIIPCLVYLFSYLHFPADLIMHMATATSLACLVLTTPVSVYSHQQRQAVLWSIFWKLLPGLVIGTILGALLASRLSTQGLKIIFALFLVLIAVRMLFGIVPKAVREISKLKLNSASLSIGGSSGLLGVGGGALTVPFLLSCNVAIREASGTSAACGFPIAIAGTISAIMTGWGTSAMPPHTLGYVYWPAAIVIAIASVIFVFVGAKLSIVLPVRITQRIFSMMLIVTAVNLIYS